MRSVVTALIGALLVACATIRQSDLDALIGVPAIALDTHSLSLGYPMVKTYTDIQAEPASRVVGSVKYLRG